MKSYLNLIFRTDVGRDFTLKVTDANEDVTDSAVAAAMLDIADENIIIGAEQLTGIKGASLFKVDRKEFNLD